MYYDDDIEQQMIEDMERVANEDFFNPQDYYPDDSEMIGVYYVNHNSDK